MEDLSFQEMKTYTTTEFAKKAHVSVRTIRYYDDIGLLKPSCYDTQGNRCYTEEDFFRLQKVLSLKYFGFSLKEIEELTREKSFEEISSLFDMQIKLVRKKIENLKQVERGLLHANKILESNGKLRWEDVINLIYLMDMEEQIFEQYRNSENLSFGIDFYNAFSHDKRGWYPWLIDQYPLENAQKILELGCGNGALWTRIDKTILMDKEIILSDISAGMIRDAMSALADLHFQYAVFDCSEIPYETESFDLVMANHMLFYVKNIAGTLSEARRVLKPGGVFCCSTYGKEHLKEIAALVQKFDERINLEYQDLHQIFCLENGMEILKEHFTEVSLRRYEDYLEVDDVEILSSYIYTCYGNQRQLLAGRKEEFQRFLKKEIGSRKFRITKDAGVFLCKR